MHTHTLPEREQATSVSCEQAVARGKEGPRQTDRERKLSRWTTQIKECALFFFLFKEPEGGNSTFGIRACVSSITCHGCLRQYISVLLLYLLLLQFCLDSSCLFFPIFILKMSCECLAFCKPVRNYFLVPL